MTDRASSAPVQGVHRYYPFVVEDRGRLGKSALTVVYIFAVLLAVTAELSRLAGDKVSKCLNGLTTKKARASKRVAEGDADYDVFQIFDLLAPAEEPLRDLVEDGTDLPASSLASSAELFKTITVALALCTTVALPINKRGKKLHVEHEYIAEVAKEFDAVDPLGEKGSADNKELKKAIEKVKAKKPSSYSSRAKPTSSSRKPESFRRGSDNRREGGRREEKSSAGRSSAADIPCMLSLPEEGTLQ
eukprot:jgi/Tetstr1/444643/TSEL_032491.t1